MRSLMNEISTLSALRISRRATAVRGLPFGPLEDVLASFEPALRSNPAGGYDLLADLLGEAPTQEGDQAGNSEYEEYIL